MPVPQKSQPIGVFDSGVGGLTVVAALMRELPAESVLYLGDTARLPYGTKSPRTVARYVRRNVDFLVERGVKAVVVACNTASALARGELEAPVLLWEVVSPGAEAAVAARSASENGRKVGVIATESTIRSDAYGRAIRELDRNIEVLGQSCPLFVPLVEEGWAADPVAEIIARRYLEPLTTAGIDTLVLGCTHYPVLRPVLQSIVGEDLAIVDSAETIARKVARGLAAHDLLAGGGQPEHHFCVTDDADRFHRIAGELLPDLSDRPRLEWVEV